MKCPYCRSSDTRVIDSRSVDDSNTIRRRRICESCSSRFTTYERVDKVPILVIKKDGSYEMYDRSKLEAGIIRSCHKRNISPEKFKKLFDEIDNAIYCYGSNEILSTIIGELVMEKLRDFDEVAYIRFMSIYRDFTDINSFIKELEKLKQQSEKQSEN